MSKSGVEITKKKNCWAKSCPTYHTVGITGVGSQTPPPPLPGRSQCGRASDFAPSLVTIAPAAQSPRGGARHYWGGWRMSDITGGAELGRFKCLSCSYRVPVLHNCTCRTVSCTHVIHLPCICHVASETDRCAHLRCRVTLVFIAGRRQDMDSSEGAHPPLRHLFS